ncbi:protein STICHEL-like [Wolffia australiana]
MAEAFVCPSELHLKKELSGASKSRCLREPETCSSRRSALPSGSSAVHSAVELEPDPSAVSRMQGRTKKTYLYNWVDRSEKTNQSIGAELEGKNEEYSARKVHGESSAADCIAKNSRQEIPARKGVRKLRKTSLLKRQNLRGSARTKLADVPLSPYQAHNSSDHSDDVAARCYSQGKVRSAKPMIQDLGYGSSPDSPLISGSGCRSLSVLRARVLRASGKKDESSSYSVTPVGSASSVERCLRKQNPASMGSWNAVSSKYPRGDGALLRSSPKQVKDGRCGGWCSPSFSDTLKRRGSSILRGGQTLSEKKKYSGVHGRKQALASASLGRPLLANGVYGDRSLTGTTSDEESTNFEEVDLYNSHRSLCQKHSPVSFKEIIGQNIVVQSLRNAILKRRIAPAYLFHGPRGTGKSSVARIFAAAMNCQTATENKPCGSCGECLEFVSGRRSKNIEEFDAAEGQGVPGLKKFLKNLQNLDSSSSSRHKVFIVEECHALQAEVWPALIRFLEEPPPRAVFVLITVDPESLPRAVLSRCQKYLFPKIKESDVVRRLEMLSTEECLDVEPDALRLIAMSSNGSLGDAEGVLDQLSLIGKRISSSLVIDLVGLVSNEKLVDLLETAMSANAVETVKRCREVLDSGIDPVSLMSQLAGVIVDAIVGERSNNTPLRRLMSSSAAGLNRLQEALRIISEAEKQLRLTDDRSTWFTAALLQLGSGPFPEADRGASGRRSNRGLSPKTDDLREDDKRPSLGFATNIYEGDDPRRTRPPPEKLEELWRMCIENCHSKTLRQLLYDQGRLVSISETQGVAVVSLAFDEESARSRAQGYLGSITDAMEMAMGHPRVKVKIQSAEDVVPRLARRRRSTDGSEGSAAKDSRDWSPYCAATTSAGSGEISLLRRTSARPEDMGENEGFVFQGSARVKQKSVLGAGEKGQAARQLPAPSKHWDDDLNQEIKALKICSEAHLHQQLLDDEPAVGLIRRSAPNGDSGLRESGRGCAWCFYWKQSEGGVGGGEERAADSASTPPQGAARRRRSVLRLGPCAGAERAASG